jgi:ADP-heptose:LPS heptosyltransferase
MHPFVTKRLGDSIHAYAVMSSLPDIASSPPFHAYAPLAGLFLGQAMSVVPYARGSVWVAPSAASFVGPRDGEHVRDTMYRAVGGVGVVKELKLVSAPARKPGRRYVVICPDAGVPYKEWPAERWTPLIEHVLSLGFDTVVCTQRGKRRIPAPLATRFADVSVTGLASLLSAAACLIGPDSGPVHLADALGTPVVGLYAATSTVTYGPYRSSTHCLDNHRQLYPADRSYDSSKHLPGTAMRTIGVGEVMAKVTHLLGSVGVER